MNKKNVFIIFSILLILASIVVKELRFGHDDHPLFIWLLSGLGFGLTCSLLWVRQVQPKIIFPSILALTSTITIFFLGLSFLDLTYDSRKTSLAVWTWPSTPAIITHQNIYETMPGKIRSSTGRYAATWNYTYELNGRKYNSTSTSTPRGYLLDFKQTEQLARVDGNRRPIGSSVVAFYNPNNPEISVLDRKTYESAETYLLLFIGIFLLVGSTVGLVAIKNKIHPRGESKK